MASVITGRHGVLRQREEENTQMRRRQSDLGVRDWSDAATGQIGLNRSWRRQGIKPSLQSPNEGLTC